MRCFKYFCMITFFAFQLTQFSARSADRKNLAVFPLAPRGVTEIEASAISDRIRNEFAKADAYKILERGLMEEILKEQAFQLSGACSESSCLVEAGQLLAVHYITGGSVTRVGNLYTIEARIVDVESGEIVKNVIEDYMGPIENLLVYTTKTVVQKLLGASDASSAIALIGTSDLLVKSNPPGGTIYIDDKPIGDVTPFTIKGLPEGEFRIKVKKDNLLGEKLIKIGANEIKSIDLNLQQEKYTIRIYTEPSEVEVYFNSTLKGKSPLDIIVTDTSRTYIIKLVKPLFKTIVEQVRFTKNTMLRLNYNLKPCGRLVIEDIKNTILFINDEQVRAGKINNESKFQYSYSVFPDVLTVHQLDLSDNKIRIVKEYHKPFETTIKFTESDRVIRIAPQFVKKEGAIEIVNGPVPINGELIGKNYNKGFNLNSSQKASFMLPYGDYLLQAAAKDYFSFNQKIELYSVQSKPVHISLKAPDKKSARTLSMIFPGAGQLYSFQFTKGGIFLLSTLTGIVWMSNSTTKYTDELEFYNEYVKAYKSATNINDMDIYRIQFTDSKEKLDKYRSQFYMSVGLCSISYLLNIIDINFFYPSHKYQNIRIHYNPEGSLYEISYHF